MSTIGKLIISKELSDSIDILHNTIGAKEWSGVLFYKLESGNISDLKDLVFKGEYVYPMDIGSAAATAFEYSGELLNVFEIYPNSIDCSSGLVHSHASLKTFFSQTDMAELATNSGAYNYYISLVVNFEKTPVCKIGFPVENSIISTMLDENGNKFNHTKTTKSIDIFDLDVEYEVSVVKPWLNDRIKELNVPKITAFPSFPQYQTGGQYPSKFDLYGSTNKSKLGILPSKVNLAEQFLLNVCNIGGHGVSLESSLKNLSTIEDPDDIEMFNVQIDTEFESIYYATYEVDTLNSTHMIEILTELMKYDSLYSGTAIYDTIKEELILHL